MFAFAGFFALIGAASFLTIVAREVYNHRRLLEGMKRHIEQQAEREAQTLVAAPLAVDKPSRD